MGGIGANPAITPVCILNCVIIARLITRLSTGLARIEAGAQGGHKLARGYLPQTTQSLHWFVDEDFGAAVARYVQAEGKMIEKHKIALANHAPFRKVE